MIFTAAVGHQNERSPRSTSPMAASSPRCAEAARKNSGSVLLTLLVRESNRSPRARRSCRSPSAACGTGLCGFRWLVAARRTRGAAAFGNLQVQWR